MQIFLILALIIAVIAVIFALQNSATVAITFLFWQFHGSLALLLIISLAVGALITFLALLPGILRGRWSMRKLHKQLAELESDLSEHKQRLEVANQRLEGQLASANPPESEGNPPEQSTTTK
jgi:putative membrane protein